MTNTRTSSLFREKMSMIVEFNKTNCEVKGRRSVGWHHPDPPAHIVHDVNYCSKYVYAGLNAIIPIRV